MNSLNAADRFSRLDKELVSQIVTFLKPGDFCIMAQISRLFKILIDGEWRKESNDTLANRSWVAEQSLKLGVAGIDIEAMTNQMVMQSLSQLESLGVSEEMKQSTLEQMKKIDWKTLIFEGLINAQSTCYTLFELKEMVKFNCSEAGKSMQKKGPAFAMLLGEKIQSKLIEEIQKNRAQETSDLAQELNESSTDNTGNESDLDDMPPLE